MIRLYLFKCGYAVLLLLFAATAAMAQQVVSGKVLAADDGSPIPGVNILEKGSSNGTVTDGDGNYRITVSSGGTLVFSFVGYVTQEAAVGSQSVIDVTLASDVTSLSEVVVVGYGSQDKKEITGSVVSLDPSSFNKGNVNDPTMLLQGKVAGLSIYNKGGDPNSPATIRLRGLSTVGSNVQPLVVIDGVIGASLDNVDPNDIETINVLKDGSAAAIYGSRGSSGVILVTTKKGKKGGLAVDYNGYVSAASIFKKLPIMSTQEYLDHGGNNLGSSTDWQKEVTRTAISNVHNIALSGGGQNTQFRMSTNFRNQEGIMKKTGWDQINTRASLSSTALDGKLHMDFSMSFTNRNQDFSFPEAFRYATLYNPTAPITFPNGDYYQAILFDNYNPVALINQNVHDGKRQNLNYGGKIEYQVFKDLTWTVNYGRQIDNNSENWYYASKSLWTGYGRNGLARKKNDNRDFSLLETYGTYSHNFGKLDLVASAGYSYQQDQSIGSNIQVGNFPTDQFGYNALQQSGNRVAGNRDFNDISSYKSPLSKIIAGFARVNLTWDNGIFFNASVRKEGSTKLGADNKWGMFPAVGAGFDINKYANIPNVNLLKVRVGYGVTGSLPNNNGLAQDDYGYDFGQGGSFIKNVDANPNLKWEEKHELNVGVEFGVGRLSGTLDVYQRKIKDFVILRAVDVTVFPSGHQYQNAGSLKTPGVELALNYNDIQIGGVHWTPGIVMSSYKTTLTSYLNPRTLSNADFGAPGQNGTYPILLEVGKPIGQIWGPVFAGVNVDDAATTDKNEAGTPKFADLNGDGKIVSNPSDALAADADMKKLGSGIPTMEIGWTNRITFGNWDMNVFFRSALGHSLINQYRAFYEPIDPGAINSYNRIFTDKAVAGLTSAQYSSLYVEKASFVRLDNATVGYTIKMNTKNVKNIRLYLSGQNLFQITNYTGIDPEPSLVDTEQNPVDVLSPGIDRRNNYFTARTFTFGVNIGIQ
jgi:iron complex outermembrane receptor protein